MYTVEINLGSRNEIVKFYSRWVAVKMAREYTECADVEGVMVYSNETGEIGFAWENGKIICLGDIDF